MLFKQLYINVMGQCFQSREYEERTRPCSQSIQMGWLDVTFCLHTGANFIITFLRSDAIASPYLLKPHLNDTETTLNYVCIEPHSSLRGHHRQFFCNLILFAICTSTFNKLCKIRIHWHVEECSVALLCK
jgi:hypothetical protein